MKTNFKSKFQTLKPLRPFLLLWSTQSLSALGSGMTSFALVIWAFEQSGSALSTSLLSIASYAPYVLLSIFAGALSDRWNKKATMLVCDTLAACTTAAVLVLLLTGNLAVWHLYLLNALNGLMNTVQQPASEVASTLLIPPEHLQRTSGLRSFSNSLNSILKPILATALLAFGSIHTVLLVDLVTFAAAFCTLLFGIRIPESAAESRQRESVLTSAKSGLLYLSENRGILDLILFLSTINFTASIYNAALPAMVLSVPNGGEMALGAVNTCAGLAMLVGSLIVSLLPAPKSRVRVICNTLLLSMGTENFILALGHSLPLWCIGAVLGWLPIPLMSANLDLLFRTHIPVEMQGRVYSARNTLQFFTIPLGYFAGGFLVDYIFEPLMAAQESGSLLTVLFGTGKGSGAAFLFLIIGFVGVLPCLIFRRDRHILNLEKTKSIVP